MNRRVAVVLAICCISFAPTLVAGAGFDGSQPLLCTVIEVTECLGGEKCKEISAEDINLPRLLWIDVGKKTIQSKKQGDEARKSQIDQVKRVDGKLMLQGAEQGGDDIRDGFGWTIAIMEDTGQMVLTASGDLVGDVAFGVCTTQ
ncbi:MAG: hypothetical protein GX443_17370 [Deltaproteobacteria bacterium]|nr:hypothetical protein [Deltaproteobacteria bacterium]